LGVGATQLAAVKVAIRRRPRIVDTGQDRERHADRWVGFIAVVVSSDLDLEVAGGGKEQFATDRVLVLLAHFAAVCRGLDEPVAALMDEADRSGRQLVGNRSAHVTTKQKRVAAAA